jgi:hypothetical protein
MARSHSGMASQDSGSGARMRRHLARAGQTEF